jgi:hypothetical protein
LEEEHPEEDQLEEEHPEEDQPEEEHPEEEHPEEDQREEDHWEEDQQMSHSLHQVSQELLQVLSSRETLVVLLLHHPQVEQVVDHLTSLHKLLRSRRLQPSSERKPPRSRKLPRVKLRNSRKPSLL